MNKMFCTEILTEELLKHKKATRDLVDWLEHNLDNMNDEGECQNFLMTSIYHDLKAASYGSERLDSEKWERRARELGFKFEWEKKSEEAQANLALKQAETKGSA